MPSSNMAGVQEKAVKLQDHLCFLIAWDLHYSLIFVFRLEYVPDRAKKWQQHLVNISSDTLSEMFVF